MKDIYNRVVKCILEVDKDGGGGVNFLQERHITNEFNICSFFDRIELCELAMECEGEFKISIPDEDIENWETIQDLVTTIEKLI